jgi:ribosomal protein S18 acetylase RimI-like enzyme
VGRLNNAIAGALQLGLQSPNNEAQKNIATITSHFVAPWARGYGLAKNMIDHAEAIAKENSIFCVQLDIRETQEAAIQLFKSKGYEHWGTNPGYAQIEGNIIKGLYFYKNI